MVRPLLLRYAVVRQKMGLPVLWLQQALYNSWMVSADEAFAAGSLALENILGLICDPVAGVGNIPCVSRNSMATVNAVLSANLVLSGFDPYIPLDQAISAMASVGRLMADGTPLHGSRRTMYHNCRTVRGAILAAVLRKNLKSIR